MVSESDPLDRPAKPPSRSTFTSSLHGAPNACSLSNRSPD